jgi:hypothetical protein
MKLSHVFLEGLLWTSDFQDRFLWAQVEAYGVLGHDTNPWFKSEEKKFLSPSN